MIVDAVNPFKEDGVIDTILVFNAIEIEELYFAVFRPSPNQCQFIMNAYWVVNKLPAGHVMVRPRPLNIIRTFTETCKLCPLQTL